MVKYADSAQRFSESGQKTACKEQISHPTHSKNSHHLAFPAKTPNTGPSCWFKCSFGSWAVCLWTLEKTNRPLHLNLPDQILRLFFTLTSEKFHCIWEPSCCSLTLLWTSSSCHFDGVQSWWFRRRDGTCQMSATSGRWLPQLEKRVTTCFRIKAHLFPLLRTSFRSDVLSVLCFRGSSPTQNMQASQCVMGGIIL